MKYRYIAHTQRRRKGHVEYLNADAVQTKQLLANNIIEPVEPPAYERETKVVAPEETKRPRKRRSKVNRDASES